jgi:hypothetical protein
VFAAARWIVRLAMFPSSLRRRRTEQAVSHESFEERVAARLQELQEASPHTDAAPGMDTPPLPSPRSFGRRVV